MSDLSEIIALRLLERIEDNQPAERIADALEGILALLERLAAKEVQP